jgi:hypothetical protein
LVEANLLEKHAVSIIRAELKMLGLRWIIQNGRGGKSKGKSQSAQSEAETEPGQWGDSKQVSRGGELGRIRQSTFRADRMGLIP